ncbi:hypothetical protein PF66_03169 [Pseudomonas asplenii]|uniref:Uncharacterized protein n=1 Tax=Pseudomonas asplenii TaxID=53407 RepID=A0A0N0VJP9_9PSED|nr:hypothetical protein PF66_03169 [Pseudomonas fuscovaginae]
MPGLLMSALRVSGCATDKDQLLPHGPHTMVDIWDGRSPESRRLRLLEMADAMDMFCQGVNVDLFNRDGTPWPEADITLVDLATYAHEGYNAQLVLSKSMEVLFRAVPPSLYLIMAMTAPEEKPERFELMKTQGLSELEAAMAMARRIDQARGISNTTILKGDT